MNISWTVDRHHPSHPIQASWESHRRTRRRGNARIQYVPRTDDRRRRDITKRLTQFICAFCSNDLGIIIWQVVNYAIAIHTSKVAACGPSSTRSPDGHLQGSVCASNGPPNPATFSGARCITIDDNECFATVGIQNAFRSVQASHSGARTRSGMKISQDSLRSGGRVEPSAPRCKYWVPRSTLPSQPPGRRQRERSD
jgi:hypothetical protein